MSSTRPSLRRFTCIRELARPEITNIYGSGVAWAPGGCTGARIVVTLMSAMRDLDVKTGLATWYRRRPGTAIIIERADDRS